MDTWSSLTTYRVGGMA